MDTSEIINTEISLPSELYQLIEQHAQAHGHSIGKEIVSILSSLLPQTLNSLEQEFSEWEAASDEDWLALETALSNEEV